MRLPGELLHPCPSGTAIKIKRMEIEQREDARGVLHSAGTLLWLSLPGILHHLSRQVVGVVGGACCGRHAELVGERFDCRHERSFFVEVQASIPEQVPLAGRQPFQVPHCEDSGQYLPSTQPYCTHSTASKIFRSTRSKAVL